MSRYTAGPPAPCVLVVEDEYYIAKEIADAIREVGGTVLGPVPTPDQALGLVWSAERIDAAVLDIKLQSELVYAVAGVLRMRGIPFVFPTGYEQSAIPDPFGDVPRWEKPFDAAALARMLPGLGERRRRRVAHVPVGAPSSRRSPRLRS